MKTETAIQILLAAINDDEVMKHGHFEASCDGVKLALQPESWTGFVRVWINDTVICHVHRDTRAVALDREKLILGASVAVVYALQDNATKHGVVPV
jgi:predicted P-loop ATPase